MPKSTKRAAAIRRYGKALRQNLTPFNAWPRDARAWARRDRIEALLAQMETDPGPPTREDPLRFMRVFEEVREWLAREQAFIRNYPILAVPAHWTRRQVASKRGL